MNEGETKTKSIDLSQKYCDKDKKQEVIEVNNGVLYPGNNEYAALAQKAKKRLGAATLRNLSVKDPLKYFQNARRRLQLINI